MTRVANLTAGEGSATVVARSSKVTGFSLSFLVGIVVGMLATFATLNGRIVAVEVEITQLTTTIDAMKKAQDAQQEQLGRLELQLARLSASDDAATHKRRQ